MKILICTILILLNSSMLYSQELKLSAVSDQIEIDSFKSRMDFFLTSNAFYSLRNESSYRKMSKYCTYEEISTFIDLPKRILEKKYFGKYIILYDVHFKPNKGLSVEIIAVFIYDSGYTCIFSFNQENQEIINHYNITLSIQDLKKKFENIYEKKRKLPIRQPMTLNLFYYSD